MAQPPQQSSVPQRNQRLMPFSAMMQHPMFQQQQYNQYVPVPPFMPPDASHHSVSSPFPGTPIWQFPPHMSPSPSSSSPSSSAVRTSHTEDADEELDMKNVSSKPASPSPSPPSSDVSDDDEEKVVKRTPSKKRKSDTGLSRKGKKAKKEKKEKSPKESKTRVSWDAKMAGRLNEVVEDKMKDGRVKTEG
ncbi:MAG TPA: hypothetical protein V6C97_05635, partial [Oculatellaceae cyanobacterium]